MSQSPPHIAVLVDTATGWGRRLVRGVSNYSGTHGPWNILVEPRGRDEEPRIPKGWDGDGIIARVSSPKLQAHLEALDDIPVVNVSGISIPSCRFPVVKSHFPTRAELAVEHFLDRGHWQFAYYGPDVFYSHDYCRQFEQSVRSQGFAFEAFVHPRRWKSMDWQARQSLLSQWLITLPQPTAILTWATFHGVHVINSCHDANIQVPGQIAVLGGDEDDLICNSCFPALSGIEVPSEQVGFEAARQLHRLMSGQRNLVDSVVDIAPTGVIARLSTDGLAIQDEELADAVQFIRRNAHRPIRVNDVVEAVSVSRRSLERRISKLLGRTMREEIARTHLERATILLATTDLSIPQVAESAGYGSPEYFATVFKAARNLSPRRFRARLRGMSE